MSKKRNGTGFKRYFDEGAFSRAKGLELNENPYEDEDAFKADAWSQGWQSGSIVVDDKLQEELLCLMKF
jgi:hypothetical protein